ncbi:MAG: oligosaccharide flippase family protein, partial [Flavobacteriales bacterium]|nr:oligosaccharide flippase family protein [Flavobacteriales bacterium]
MGIVRRQSFWSTVAAYTGSAIGYLNWGLILPNLMSLSNFGLLKLVYDVSYFFAGFAHMGIYPTITKYYPYAKTEDRKNSGLLSYALLHGGIGAIIFLLFAVLFRDWIISFYNEKSPIFGDYYWYVIPLTLYYLFFGLLYTYCFSFFKSVFPNYIKDVILRLFILVPVGLLYLLQWDVHTFLRWFTAVHFLSLAMLIGYVYHLGYFRLGNPAELFEKVSLSKINKYAASNLLIGSGGIMLKYIDTIMVSAMLGLGYTAIYGLAFMIASVIEQPKQAMFKVTVPLAADYWKKGEIQKINELYQRTSLNLMIIALFLASLIAINMRDIYTFLPPEYAGGMNVVLIILAAKCVYMTFGMTDELLQISDYYTFRFLSTSLILIIVVGSNYILIPIFGINGAAVGSLLSMLTQQFFLWTYLYFKRRLFPFTKNHLLAF